MPNTKHTTRPHNKKKPLTKVYVKKIPPVDITDSHLKLILERLGTAQELGRACRVCKRWNTFIGENANILWRNIYSLDLRDTTLPITDWKQELRKTSFRYLTQNSKKGAKAQKEKERMEQIKKTANVDIVDSELGLRFRITSFGFDAEYEMNGEKGQISLWTDDRRRAVRDFMPVTRHILKNFAALDEEATTFASDPGLYELETDEDEELDEGKEEDEKIARCFNEEDGDLHMEEPTEMTRGEFKARLRKKLPSISVELQNGFYSSRHYPKKFSFLYDDDEMFYGDNINCMFTQDKEGDYFVYLAGQVSGVN